MKVTVSQSIIDRLAAHSEAAGKHMDPHDAVPVGGGMFEVALDDDVAEALLAVDPDPVRAIEIVLSSGVGRA